MILSSGVMNYYWVIPLDKQIAKDRQEISAKQALIKDVWENITYKESKADVAILILALAKEDKDNAQKISAYYLSLLNLPQDLALIEVVKALENEKKNKVDYINRLYDEQVKLSSQILSLETAKKHYADIAFFLQILSLILIIIKKDMPDT